MAPQVAPNVTSMPGMKKGGMMKSDSKEDMKMDMAQDKKMIKKAFSMHDKQEHKGEHTNLSKLKKIAKKHNLVLLEDNCESMGAELEGNQTGTFGIGGTFSTFFSHHISTMEGGLVVTNDTNLYEIMLSMRAHGWTRNLPATNTVFTKTGEPWDDLFRFVLPGFNFRPLELEGALGSSQIEKLSQFVKVRRDNAEIFKKIMKSKNDFRIQAENGTSSWFGFSIVLTGKLKGLRRELVEILNQSGIESRPIVTGDFTQNPVLKHLNHAPLIDYPVAADIHENGLFLGNHHYDLNLQLEKLSQVLSEFEDTHG
jgi:CDP-6-deoxy-D-xylo-4-hexulose-3-dehydrase